MAHYTFPPRRRFILILLWIFLPPTLVSCMLNSFNTAGFSDGQQQWMEVGGCVALVKLLGKLSWGVWCGLLSHANRHKLSIDARHAKNICGCHSHAATSACCTATAAAGRSWPPDIFFCPCPLKKSSEPRRFPTWSSLFSFVCAPTCETFLGEFIVTKRSALLPI